MWPLGVFFLLAKYVTLLLPCAAEFTLPTTTTEEVPTFYHFGEYDGVICNGTAFTYNPQLGCNGWRNLSEHECKIKCMLGEVLGNCPQRLCFALAYFPKEGACHLFDHANCVAFRPEARVESYVKEHSSSVTVPSNLNVSLGALALAAGAGIVAAAEFSQRHRNGSGTAVQPSSGAVSETARHVRDFIRRSFSTSAQPMVPKEALPIGPGTSLSPMETSGAHGQDGSSGMLGTFGMHVLGALFVLLLIFIIVAIYKALGKRKRRDNKDGNSDEEEAQIFDRDLE